MPGKRKGKGGRPRENKNFLTRNIGGVSGIEQLREEIIADAKQRVKEQEEEREKQLSLKKKSRSSSAHNKQEREAVEEKWEHLFNVYKSIHTIQGELKRIRERLGNTKNDPRGEVRMYSREITQREGILGKILTQINRHRIKYGLPELSMKEALERYPKKSNKKR